MQYAVALAAALASLVVAAPARTPIAYDFAAVPSIEQLRKVRFLPVPDGITAHPFEERGFVRVPMDYARPAESPTLRIFYRLMPRHGSTPRDSGAPLLVVVNGGPALPSSRLRPYDYDYESPTAKMVTKDRLAALLSRFRVLVLDQRGNGHSAPLDMADPEVSPAVIARYFDSVHIARDHEEVIRAVMPDGEPFYMVAHSYAGLVASRYVTDPAIRRQPAGLVFATALLPHGDAVHSFLARRTSQLELNRALLRAVPDVKALLARVRRHLRASGLDPGNVNHLWIWLGKGPTGEWEKALRDQAEELLKLDRRGLQEFLDREASKADLHNYILSAKEMTPGFTDRTLAAMLVKRIPFEPWMLDEQWTLVRLEGDARWVGPMLDRLDRAPPRLEPPFPPLQDFRRAVAALDVLFVYGEGDAYVGANAPERARAFAVEGRSRIETLPGGHRAVFLAPGVELLSAWIAGLRAGGPALTPASLPSGSPGR